MTRDSQPICSQLSSKILQEIFLKSLLDLQTSLKKIPSSTLLKKRKRKKRMNMKKVKKMKKKKVKRKKRMKNESSCNTCLVMTHLSFK